jgi:hypothetical protein
LFSHLQLVNPCQPEIMPLRPRVLASGPCQNGKTTSPRRIPLRFITARMKLSTAAKFCFLVVITRLSACVPTRPGASQYAVRCRLLFRIHLRTIPHIHRHALIYAGAQKNLGPSGDTIVIVRKDLLVDTASATLLTGMPACQSSWSARFRRAMTACTTRHRHSQST